VGKSCYSCKKEIGMLEIRQYSKSEIMDLHRQLPDGMTDHDKICFNCRESLPNSSGEYHTTKRPSDLWYLLPIFFGLIGGLVMFFVLKDEDRKMAKDGVILGAVLSVIGGIVFAMSYGAIVASLFG